MNLEQNNNNKYIKFLTNKSYHSKKGKNKAVFLAIILTTVMFTVLFTIYFSLAKTEEKGIIRQVGSSSHASFKEITAAEEEKIIAHPDIVEYGSTIVLGYGNNEELKYYGRSSEVRYGDQKFLEYGFSQPTTGRMPTEENEAATSTAVLDALKIPHKIGEKFTIEWESGTEEIPPQSKEFVLCGYWETDIVQFADMIWVSENYVNQFQKDGNIDLDVMFKNTVGLEKKAKKVLADCNLPDVKYNTSWAYNNLLDKSLKDNIPYLLGVLLIFISGYLIIYNIFQISVASQIRFYGMLKTLGTTKKQIKKIIYGEARKLCWIGIPLGICLGYAVGAAILPVAIGIEREGGVVLSSNLFIFLGAGIFSYCTVLFSCSIPGRIAGNVSPVDALNYSDNTIKSQRKHKKSRKGTKIGLMAFSNLGRNKRRTVIIIISMALGMVVLNCVYAVNKSFDINKYLQVMIVSDFEITDPKHTRAIRIGEPEVKSGITESFIEELQNIGNLKSVDRLYYGESIQSLTDDVYQRITDFFEENDKERYNQMLFDNTWIESYDKMRATKECYASVYGIDSGLIEKGEILAGSFDLEKFSTGKYVLASVSKSIINEIGLENCISYLPGDKIQLNGETYEIMALTDSPIGGNFQSREAGFSLEYYIHTNQFMKLYSDKDIMKLFVDVKKDSFKKMEKFLSDYKQTANFIMNYESRQDYIKSYKEQTTAMTIMGQTLAIMIAGIGILNFMNSIITAIMSRKLEFTMLQSIGMTKKQLLKMLITECMYYVTFAGGTSFILASLAVGIGVRSYTEQAWTQTFHFTLFPILVCIPVLILIAVMIPMLCFKNIEKKSIIERLRESETK